MNAQVSKSIAKLYDADSNANIIWNVRFVQLCVQNKYYCTSIMYLATVLSIGAIAVNKKCRQFSHEANILAEGDKKVIDKYLIH